MKTLAYFSYIIIVATFATLIALTIKNFMDYREAQLNCALTQFEEGSSTNPSHTKECGK